LPTEPRDLGTVWGNRIRPRPCLCQNFKPTAAEESGILTVPKAGVRELARSRLINTRSGVEPEYSLDGKIEFLGKGAQAVDLLTGCIVVPRLKPTAGIGFPSPARFSGPTRAVLFENCGCPASRLAASQNLSPRHLLLFMRRLPVYLPGGCPKFQRGPDHSKQGGFWPNELLARQMLLVET
jgi:hypothetical protein